MEYLLLSLVAFGTALLTFFSGFGLGTLLMPIAALFFPPEVAIALTGVVHFFNNIFKWWLVGGHADKKVLWAFGVPAVIAALAGAWVLGQLTDIPPLFSYQIGTKIIEVYPVKVVIAILLLIFALMEVVPFLKNIHFDKNKLPVGGVLSGFFGGLSGMQGALRSAFLMKAGLSKEAFVGTTVVISAWVDITRLSVYASRMLSTDMRTYLPLMLTVTIAGIAGSYVGNTLLEKVTLRTVQQLVTVGIVLLALALGMGLL